MRDWSTRAAIDGMHDRLRVYDEQRYSGESVAALDAAQARADAALVRWGEKALPPVTGERPVDYRRRLLATVQTRAPKYKDKNFATVPADLLGTFEEMVYADAAAAALDPSSVPPGQMRMIQERDAVGRLITRWVGSEVGPWFDVFTQPGARCTLNRTMADNAREKAR